MSEAPALDGATAGGDARAFGGWLDMVLRPERFFPEGARKLKPSLLVLLVYALGIAAAMDRIEFSTLRSATPSSLDKIGESWSLYWVSVMVGGLVSGPIAYFLGGWWYWLRARWSGAKGPESRLARRVYALTSSIVTLPAIALVALQTAQEADPASMWAGGSLAATTLVTPFFSTFVSYRAAVTTFALSRGRALFWFAAFPGLFYGALIVGGGLLGLGFFADG